MIGAAPRPSRPPIGGPPELFACRRRLGPQLRGRAAGAAQKFPSASSPAGRAQGPEPPPPAAAARSLGTPRRSTGALRRELGADEGARRGGAAGPCPGQLRAGTRGPGRRQARPPSRGRRAGDAAPGGGRAPGSQRRFLPTWGREHGAVSAPRSATPPRAGSPWPGRTAPL